MKQSEKPAVVAGAFLMTFAAVILTSLIIQLLDFGVAPSAFALALSNFGRMLYTVYGISSFLIPVYLFVSAILLYLPGFTKRRGVYLLFSIIPFFTIVAIERFGANLFASEAAAYQLIKYSAIVLVSILLIAIEYLLIGIIVDSVMGVKKPVPVKVPSGVKPVVSAPAASAESAEEIPELPYADEEEIVAEKPSAPAVQAPAPAKDVDPAETVEAKPVPAEKPVKYVHRAEVDTTASQIDNIDKEEPITVVFGNVPSMNVDGTAAEAESASEVPAPAVETEAVAASEAESAPAAAPEAAAEDPVATAAFEAEPAEAAAEEPSEPAAEPAVETAAPVAEEPVTETVNDDIAAQPSEEADAEEKELAEDDVDDDVLSKLDAALGEFQLPPEASIPADVPMTPISLTPAAAAAATTATAKIAAEKPKGGLLASASAYNVSKAPSDSVIHMTPQKPAPEAPATPAPSVEPAASTPIPEPVAPAPEPIMIREPEAAIEELIEKPVAPAAIAPENSFEPSFEPTFALPEDDEPPVEQEVEQPVLSESDRSEVDSALKEIDEGLYSEEEAAFFDDPFEEQLSLDEDAGGDADEGDDKIPFEVAPVKGAYSVPTEGILNNFENNPYWIIDDETKQAGVILKETLSEFKIEAEVTGIRKGPVVTMFEILPAPGVKLTKIVALQDNIALRLAASSVRIVAPIPGKQAVGVEVPNRERAMVSFRELIEKELPAYDKMQIPVVLGKDITGDAQVLDLAATPHLLIAGSTGSGKSVCVNSMILSILYKRSPNDVKLILIDPKIVELKLYNDIPHLLTPVITEPKKAFQSLQYCLCEMERRYAMLDHMGVRDIKSYNKRIKERHVMQEKLPYIVVVIDEFADLMATTGKELESTIARLCAMSRAVGIHLVLATQRPSIDVITGLIKANIPTRIAFMVASKTDSRIIIDQMGAEKLLGKGDMLYASAIDPFPVRIQGTFVTDDEVENVVEYVKKYGPPEYIDEEIFVEDEDDETAEPSLFGDGEDPLYDQALEIVVQAGKASASYIQRRLKIGYNRAARLVEEMEDRGIVGPANGSKPREIIHIP